MLRSRRLTLVLLAIIALLAGIEAWQFGLIPSCNRETIGVNNCKAVVEGPVKSINDGDGLYLEGFALQIRLWGVLAPEWGQPGYAEATEHLKALVLGKSLRCQKRGFEEYDGYHAARYSGQCSLPNGDDISRLMIASGLVKEDCERTGRLYSGVCKGE
ncbi:MAG: hypothetical protein WAW96_16595 [Alphaproteobacteria bacterium]